MGRQGIMDTLCDTLFHHRNTRRAYCQVILQSVHSRWNRPNGVSNKSIEEFIYDPVSGVCLTIGVTFKTYAIYTIPLIFDVIIVILTAIKTYRLAIAMQGQSGAAIVRTLRSPDTVWIFIFHSW